MGDIICPKTSPCMPAGIKPRYTVGAEDAAKEGTSDAAVKPAEDAAGLLLGKCREREQLVEGEVQAITGLNREEASRLEGVLGDRVITAGELRELQRMVSLGRTSDSDRMLRIAQLVSHDLPESMARREASRTDIDKQSLFFKPIPLLLAIAESGVHGFDPQLRSAALYALPDCTGREAWCDAIFASAADPDTRVRAAAIVNLEGADGGRSRDLVVKAAKDPSVDVRLHAVPRLPFSLLRQIAVSDPDAGVRAMALWRVSMNAMTESIAAQQIMMQALADPSPCVRKEAAAGLQLLAEQECERLGIDCNKLKGLEPAPLPHATVPPPLPRATVPPPQPQLSPPHDHPSEF